MLLIYYSDNANADEDALPEPPADEPQDHDYFEPDHELLRDIDNGQARVAALLAGMPLCKCRWFAAWQLPCIHIWHHHLMFGSLIPAHFAQLGSLWAENGFEIYEEIEMPFENAFDGIIGMPSRQKLQVREITEQVTAGVFRLRDTVIARGGSVDDTDILITRFINKVKESIDVSLSVNIEELEQQRLEAMGDD